MNATGTTGDAIRPAREAVCEAGLEHGLRRIVEALVRRQPGLVAVYLYGSAAHGGLRPDSDVDVAVLAERPLGKRELFDLSLELQPLISRHLDLVDLKQAGLPLVGEVLDGGRLLWSATDSRQAREENWLLSRRCAFNEEISPLVRDIIARGSVYGG